MSEEDQLWYSKGVAVKSKIRTAQPGNHVLGNVLIKEKVDRWTWTSLEREIQFVNDMSGQLFCEFSHHKELFLQS